MESLRMGELAVSGRAGDELAAIGLGSCIGLTLIDLHAGIVGLAHIVLPDSLGKPAPSAKFADLAVPELIARVLAAGAIRRRLQAIMVGGASMFSASTTTLDIGARNIKAVHDALAQAGVPVIAEQTGGTRGRTATVLVGEHVSCRVAGEEPQTLISLADQRRAPAPSQRPAKLTAPAPVWAGGAS